MSYSITSNLNGGLGATPNDKVDKGDKVRLRFRPGAGVDGPKGAQLAAKLTELVVGTEHFDTPKYSGWGAGNDAGLLIVESETKSDNYTLQQIANFMTGIAARAARETSMPVTFINAVWNPGWFTSNVTAFSQAPSAEQPGTPTPGGGAPDPITGRDEAASDKPSLLSSPVFIGATVIGVAGLAYLVYRQNRG